MTGVAAPAHGTLGLSSPWCRQGLPGDQRTEVQARVPVGMTLGVACGSRGPGKPWRLRLVSDADRSVALVALDVWDRPLREACLMALARYRDRGSEA